MLQVSYMEVRALNGKEWNTEIHNEDIWFNPEKHELLENLSLPQFQKNENISFLTNFLGKHGCMIIFEN